MFGSFSVFILVVMLLRNKPALVEHFEKGVKNAFKKVESKYMEKAVSKIGSAIIIQEPFAEQSNGLFLCNGNASLKWQRGCMVKVNINL